MLAEKGWAPPESERRIAAFPDVRRIDLPGVGHRMHWFAADAVADALLEFLPE